MHLITSNYGIILGSRSPQCFTLLVFPSVTVASVDIQECIFCD